MKVKADNLYVIYADGDSMEPYIFEGDVVLFDGSDTEPRDRQVYAIRRPDGGISIKRIVQQLAGGWMIRSDNPDKSAYPDEQVSRATLHDMPILGRVIWRGGGIG
ncbi:putative HTH-type transcriptional regulator [compost metagenome]